MTAQAQVVALWRYPVKSLQGEAVGSADIELDGMRGDRLWGIRDGATGRILTARREPALLFASARLLENDQPEITLPGGERVCGLGRETDAALSAWLERPVSLVPAAGAAGANAEFFADATDDSSPAIEWTMPAGRFVDAMPLLLLTTASLRAGSELHPAGEWNPRRFRANVLIDVEGDSERAADGWVEDGWCGRALQLGAAVVRPEQPCVRCTMVTRPQPGLARDLDIYKTLSHHHAGTFGAWTSVRTPGTVAVGDPVLEAR